MTEHDTQLITLVKLVDRVPGPPPAPMCRRDCLPTYSDRLCLQALVMVMARNLPTEHARLSMLAQPTPEMYARRALLTVDGRFPMRRP